MTCLAGARPAGGGSGSRWTRDSSEVALERGPVREAAQAGESKHAVGAKRWWSWICQIELAQGLETGINIAAMKLLRRRGTLRR